MVKRKYYRTIGAIALLIVFVTSCAETPMFIQQALGRGVAEQRERQGDEWCPKITVFTVSPSAVKCGGQISLELAATSLSGGPLTYSWDIEGQMFDTGQKAVWNTPTGQTIDEPEQVFTVRGIVSDGQCAVTRSAEVTVLCNSALDVMVHFEFGKSKLDSTAKTQLDEVGEKLQQSPIHTVLIGGHTDYVGSDQTNERLGKRRAEAVKNYLSKTWNLAPDRIITQSFGEEKPIAPNETSTGRAKNRRAEVFRVILSTE